MKHNPDGGHTPTSKCLELRAIEKQASEALEDDVFFDEHTLRKMAQDDPVVNIIMGRAERHGFTAVAGSLIKQVKN